jgi:beta-lactamase regulating signal transducer with metallopeptidase domain
MEWVVPGSAELWQSALVGVPIALACGVFSRLLPLRPATRHTLWVAALLGFALPLVLPSAESLDVASHLPDFAVVAPFADTVAPTDAAETVASGVLEEPLNSGASVFTSESSLPLDAGHAPETASAFRGDEPAALEPAHEAESESTPRVVLESQSKPHAPPRAHRAAPPAVVSDADESLNREPATYTPSRVDLTSEIRTPVVTGFATDAPARRSSPGDDVSPINLGEIWAAIQGWLAAVGAIVVTALRGMARLPAMPASAWLVGIGVVALIQLVRLWRFRRRLAKALPAPSVVRRTVEDVSAEIGLAKAPETLLIDARISPLVWWGRSPTLVIPSRLWAQLDKHGRRAILCHELAHLRRRDHWIIWVEQAVGLAYWWNPLVWWVRKRIQEEADLACDAWVTWLMPRDRRAYAEALLRTRQFLNSSRADVPVGGMAAASGRARDFARRITMVMTKSERPRRSMTGFVLAAAVVALGWATSPAWSCPDANKDKAKVKKTTTMQPAATCQATTECKTATGATVIAVPSGQTGVTCTSADGATVVAVPSGQAGAVTCTSGDGATVISAPTGLTTSVHGAHAATLAPLTTDKVGVRFHQPGVFTLGGGMGGGAGGGALTPLSGAVAWPSGGGATTLFSQAAPNKNPFHAYTVLAQQSGGDDDLEKRLAKLEEELKKLSKELKEERTGRRARPAMAPTTPAAPAAPASPRAPQARAFGGGGSGDAAAGSVVIKSYALPSGKLDALYNFLVRDDVPIRVRKDGDKLEVHATEAQHEVFKAFLRMVNPEGGAQSGARGASGRNARQSVARAAEKGTLYDAAVQKKVEEALAKVNSGDVQKAMREALAARELWTAAEAKSLKPRVAEQLRALTERARSHTDSRRSEVESLQNQAEALTTQAEKLTKQAAEIMAAAEAAAQGAVAGSEKVLETRKRDMERAARDLEKRSRELEKQAEKLEKKASEDEEKNEESSSMAEELAELASAIDISDVSEEIEIEGLDEMIDAAADSAADEAPEAIEVPDIDVPEIEIPAIDVPAAITPSPSAPAAAPVTPVSDSPKATETVKR